MWFTFHPFRQFQVEQDIGEFALCVDVYAIVVSLEHDVVPLHVSLALKKKHMNSCCLDVAGNGLAETSRTCDWHNEPQTSTNHLVSR